MQYRVSKVGNSHTIVYSIMFIVLKYFLYIFINYTSKILPKYIGINVHARKFI